MISPYYRQIDWEGLGPYDLQRFEQKVFDHYRSKGFPYIYLTPTQKIDAFLKMKRMDYRNILDGKNFRQTMHGLGLAWVYFPHAYEIRCNKMKTAMEAYLDDKILMSAIKKSMSHNHNITDNSVRKILKLHTGVQTVANFRPSTAGCIYELFSGDGVVWDMSAGFGGRMLGAMTSNRLKKYIAVDPSTKTFDGLIQMKEDLKDLHDKEIELYETGSELFTPDKESLDLCFTSPPYFNCERYSEDKGQSCIQYDNKDAWLNEFMKETLDNCYWGLKPEGILMINIANVASYKTLCDDTVEMALKCGFELIDTFGYTLSNINKAGFKIEPVYIFKKRSYIKNGSDIIKDCVTWNSVEDISDLFE